MDPLIGHSITVFLAFFAVMNPIANAAAFVGLTGNQDKAARKKTALQSIVTASGRLSHVARTAVENAPPPERSG